MLDTKTVQENTDCRDLVACDLGEPKYRSNTYNIYKCPLHHEKKGYSLVVYANHSYCFGKCGGGGDAIAWLQRYHQLSFRAACEQLSSGRWLVGGLFPNRPVLHKKPTPTQNGKQLLIALPTWP